MENTKDDQSTGKELDESEEPEDEKIPEPVIEESHPHLYQQVIRFLSGNSFCLECFGRQFSMLGTLTSNKVRSEALLMGLTMEAHNFLQKETLSHQFTLHDRSPLDILRLLSTQMNFSLLNADPSTLSHPDDTFMKWILRVLWSFIHPS